MNQLYPIFLKNNKLNILIIGGGNIALEKLIFLFKNSPQSKVTLLSPVILDKVKLFIQKNNIASILDFYNKKYLTNYHLVISATNNNKVNFNIYSDCRKLNILVNTADNPNLCDFYMGGVVTKGNLKIAISTNGKSPTIAKRFREILEEVLPNEIDQLLIEINKYRKTLKMNFDQKKEILNKLTLLKTKK